MAEDHVALLAGPHAVQRSVLPAFAGDGLTMRQKRGSKLLKLIAEPVEQTA